MFDVEFTKIIWFYGEHQSNLIASLKEVEFVEGMKPELLSPEALKSHVTLAIIDDLAQEISKEFLVSLFTKISHHR